jgi:hypothetical protein
MLSLSLWLAISSALHASCTSPHANHFLVMFGYHIFFVKMLDWGALHVPFHTTSLCIKSGALTSSSSSSNYQIKP